MPPQGFTIGDVAHATGLKISTLRFYEREGLMLGPTPRDVSGHRRFDEHDLVWIGGLLMLRATGMSVAGMRALADLSREHGTGGERLSTLQAHRERVLEEMERF